MGHELQNVKFVILSDGSGFPHVFWKCIRAISAGATIWGDYGDNYWSEYHPDAPTHGLLSVMMRRLLGTLRGCSAQFPIAVDSNRAPGHL